MNGLNIPIFVGFRPLTGTLLSKRGLFSGTRAGIFVSVPSRGLSYLNNKTKNLRLRIKVSVPSRGLSYLNFALYELLTKPINVSVPSRGLSYLNKTMLKFKKDKLIVSVPSRGLSYLNTIRQFSLPKRLFSLVCVANDILMIKEFNVFI